MIRSHSVRRIILFFLSAALASAAAAQTPLPPDKKWKDEDEASYVSANGNTKSTTASAKNTFTTAYKRTTLELIGSALASSSAGQSTAEKYAASEKGTYKITDRNYVFEKTGWDKDRFAGIRNRYDLGAGLGRDLIKTPRNLLIAELGGGWIDEERYKAPTDSFASGRAYSKYTFTISETASFSQDAEYIHNFDNPDGFRVNTETAITAALSTHFSLKSSYAWHHVGNPPPGAGRNDTLTSMALIAVY